MNDDCLHLCPSAKISVAYYFKIKPPQKLVLQKTFKFSYLSTKISIAKLMLLGYLTFLAHHLQIRNTKSPKRSIKNKPLRHEENQSKGNGI